MTRESRWKAKPGPYGAAHAGPGAEPTTLNGSSCMTVADRADKAQLRTPKPAVRVSAQAERAIKKAGLRPWVQRHRDEVRERLADAAGERSGPARAGGKSAGRRRRPAGDAEGGALANNAAKVSPQRVDRVRTCWEALNVLWRISDLERVQKCRKVTRLPDGMVAARVSTEHGGGFAGLSTCGSPWVCPLCSRRIAMQRAAEVARAIDWAEDQGGMALHLVLTVQHHRGHRLTEVWDANSAGWKRVANGAGWQQFKTRHGVLGNIRAIETEIGDEFGWHVHSHVLLLLDRPVSQDTADAIGEWIWRKWDKGLRKKGFSSLRRIYDERAGKFVDVGVSVTRATDREHVHALGGYFSKMAFELTHGQQKHGREKVGTGRHRSPFQLLGELVAQLDPSTGELKDGYDPDAFAADLALWHEWERGSWRREQMPWSKGLKARIGIKDVTDEEAAEEEAGDADMLLLPIETWRAIRWKAWQAVLTMEEHGIAGLRRWLDRRGLDYEEATRKTPD